MNNKIREEDLNRAKQKVRMSEAKEKINEQIEGLSTEDSVKEELKSIVELASKDSLGRVNLATDNKDIKERIGIILDKENPRLALIKRFIDIETGRGEEGIEEKSLEDIYRYVNTNEISISNLAKFSLQRTSQEQAQNAHNVENEKLEERGNELNND